MKTPVVFIVFRRPVVTRRVLSAIREAQPEILFIVADGPRREQEEEARLCIEVRALVDTMVDWPCTVIKIYAEENLGCARRVSSGLTEVFQQVEEAIILEDDCLPDVTFFPFCEQLLEHYREDERVFQIAGCRLTFGDFTCGKSYYFSRYPHCWGWATWRRAWRHYDHGMRVWLQKREEGWKNGPTSKRERRAWASSFDGVFSGRTDTWDYRWTAICWSLGVWSVTPAQNLVSNIGFGADSTHTKDGKWGGIPVCSMVFPLTHPTAVKGNELCDAETGRLVFEQSGLVQRFCRRIKRILSR